VSASGDSSSGSELAERGFGGTRNNDRWLAAYIRVLSEPTPSVGSLATFGLTPDEAEQALTWMLQRGLVSVDDGLLIIVNPRDSLSRHASRLEVRAHNLRSMAGELSQLYYRSRLTRQFDFGLRFLLDHDELEANRMEAVSGAMHTIIATWRQDDYSVEALHRRRFLPGADLADKGVELRELLAVDLLGHAHEAILDRVGRGSLMRFVPRFPVSLLLVDDSVVVAELTREETSGPIGLRITHPVLVDVIGEILEDYWQRGTELSLTLVEATIDDRDQRILQLLAAGVPDAAIARQLRVSERTLQRRVQHLMGVLGASSRFQAGALASSRGLI